MRPTFQTIFTAPKGNCYAACLATLLGAQLSAVPCYHGEKGDWFRGYRRWGQAHNLGLVCFANPDGSHMEPGDGWPEADAQGLVIASIDSPRLEGVHHAVVAERGICIHDPFPGRSRVPSGTPLLSISSYDVIMPLDASVPMAVECWGVHAEMHAPEEEDLPELDFLLREFDSTPFPLPVWGREQDDPRAVVAAWTAWAESKEMQARRSEWEADARSRWPTPHLHPATAAAD